MAKEDDQIRPYASSEKKPAEAEDSIARVPDENYRKMPTCSEHLETTTEGAKVASDAEKRIGIRDALRKHRPAVFWAILAQSTVVMEGFDLALLTGFYAYPEFQVGTPRSVGWENARGMKLRLIYTISVEGFRSGSGW
jgi:hypothetical protein